MTAYQYFQDKELQCHCGCKQNKMDEDFMHLLEEMRREAGFPFVITSAYRCPEWNAQTSHTGAIGPHTTGKAVDIKCTHEKAHKILGLAIKYGIHGIGISQKGDWGSRFIHIDNARDDKKLWTY